MNNTLHKENDFTYSNLILRWMHSLKENPAFISRKSKGLWCLHFSLLQGILKKGKCIQRYANKTNKIA